MRRVAVALGVVGCVAFQGAAGPAAAALGEWGDFNGDGVGDLAAGVPFEELGSSSSAGLVNVLYGSTDGIRPRGNQVWHQGRRQIAGDIETGDRFGNSLVAGDFDGYGRGDLAVGAPFEEADAKASAGIVHVLYGTRDGLSAQGSQLWHQDVEGIADDIENGDRFGEALGAGDFDSNGRTDLAIAVPGEDVGGNQGAGAVHILWGGRNGLRSGGAQFLSQARRGVAGDPEVGDGFGLTLATGGAGLGGAHDLAVASPGDGIGGAVYVFYGARDGFDTRESQRWHRGRRGIPGEVEAGEGFGAGLAFGSFGKSSVGDLAIGAPNADVGPVPDAGEVLVIYGTLDGLAARGSKAWNQARRGIAEDPEPGDLFGASLASANFGEGSRDDLAVGTPGESRLAIIRAGAVHVLYGSPRGIGSARSQLWHQDRRNLPEQAQPDDAFGFDLLSGNFGRTAQADLAVQAIFESVGTKAMAGALNVLYGAPTGLRSRGSQLWHQDRNRVRQEAEPGDRFGTLTRFLD
jgi:hypothetical protein